MRSWPEPKSRAGCSTDGATHKPYLVFETERMHEYSRVGGRQREREKEGIPNRLCTVCTEPDTGLKLMTQRSWPELKPRGGHLTYWAWKTKGHLIKSTSFCHLCLGKRLLPAFSFVQSIIVAQTNYLQFTFLAIPPDGIESEAREICGLEHTSEARKG